MRPGRSRELDVLYGVIHIQPHQKLLAVSWSKGRATAHVEGMLAQIITNIKTPRKNGVA